MRLVLSEWARVISNSRMGYPQEEGGEAAPIGAPSVTVDGEGSEIKLREEVS